MDRVSRFEEGVSPVGREVYASDLPGFTGDLFVRRMDFAEVDDYVTGHDHGVDHVTFVSHGRIHFQCEVTGINREVAAPEWVFTPARSRHQMTAIEAHSRAWCVFVNPDPSNTTDTTRFS